MSAQTFYIDVRVFFLAGEALIKQRRGWMFSMRLQTAQLPGQPDCSLLGAVHQNLTF